MEFERLPTQGHVDTYSPMAELRFYSGVPWDDTYNHCRLYKSKSDLLAHLEKWRVHPSNQLHSMTPIRIGSHAVKVPFAEIKMLKINYFAFCNHMYSNEWIFGFVNGFEWLSSHSTTVHLKYDIFQNSIYDAKIQPCMVEWEHIPRSEDSNTACRTSVSLDVGRVYCHNVISLTYPFSNLCAYVTEGATGLDFEPKIYNDMFNSCALWSMSMYDENKVLDSWKALQDAYEGNPDAIVSVFQAPSICMPDKIRKKENYSERTVSYKRGDLFGGYVPKNKKLYSYPFISVVADNNAGQTAEYYYEDASARDSITFRAVGALATMPQIMTFPKNYMGVNECTSKGLVSNAYALCGWNSDVFKAWQAQNQSQRSLASINNKIDAVVGGVKGAVSGASQGATMGAGGAVLGGAVGGVTGSYSGIYKDLQMSAQEEDMQRIPPQTRGKTLSESINVAMRLNSVNLYQMCCRKEYAQKADSFFEKYGYPLNKIKQPRFNTRSSWNYIKTSNCNFIGKVELQDLAGLRAIFDSGVTIWHTDDVGNYALANN